MMAHAAITVADDDGIGAAALAAFEQARLKIGRTPPPVDAPRQRRFLDALVPLSKDVLLALGRFPQVIGYDAKVGHFFPDPFGFGVEPGNVLAGSRVLDLVLVVPDANANIEFVVDDAEPAACVPADAGIAPRSEEHTSELQSLMRISYAVFCLKKKKHAH